MRVDCGRARTVVSAESVRGRAPIKLDALETHTAHARNRGGSDGEDHGLVLSVMSFTRVTFSHRGRNVQSIRRNAAFVSVQRIRVRMRLSAS